MTYLAEVLADSPLAYYRLGDASGTTCTDSSGNARHMTYAASPTLGVAGALTVSGDTDTAVTFNGTTQYANIASAAWMNGMGALTLECWYKGTDTSGSLISRGSNPANYRLGITGGNAFMEVATTTSTLIQGTSNVADGNWHHIAGTWDGTTYRVYVDGVQENSAAKTGSLQTGSNSLRIGQRNSDSFIAGTVDEAAVYGSNIGGTRIAAHYAAGVSPVVSGSASLSLSASGTAVAATAGSAALSLSASGAATTPASGSASLTFDATGDTEPPQAATGTASLSLSASGGAGAGVAGTASLDLSATGAATGSEAVSGTAVLSLSATGSATLADSGTAFLNLTASGAAAQLFTTDTSNAFDGLDFTFVATAEVTRPAAPVPPGLVLGEKVDKAIPYPEPVMVGGRPT